MPSPKHPRLPEFFVYTLAAKAVVFYVGMGRAKRASDRVRYVKNLIRREKLGKRVDWDFGTHVVAEFLKRGVEPKPKYLYSGLTRKRALILERQAIDRYVSRGFILVNRGHNPKRPATVQQFWEIWNGK
jgi:hypothetical protein